MWSILYEADGQIHQGGPFNTERRAMNWFKESEEFDINSQRVYLIDPNHRMIELDESCKQD